MDTPFGIEAPPAPSTVADTGLAFDQLQQLLMKTLYTGEATGTMLADKMRLPFSALEEIVERARQERLLEVRGASGAGTAAYRYALTDLGRDRARAYLAINQYVGPAPVPLATYVAAMEALQASRGYITRERIETAFTHLVVSPSILEQLGPALNGGRALFLHGPPGNGKTVLAEGLGRTLGGEIYIPYAIDVDGQTISLFDPVNHESLESKDSGGSVLASAIRDRRWVRIKRPVVMVGGELTLDMLDLTFNPISKFYEAPIQLKANGGVFLVDDFGRQRIRPEELLNRWIVPLESRVDYLTLHTGKKFQVPFNVLIVFATNLNPASLADEAFLRRIPYKVAVENPTIEEYARIFELNCRQRGLRFHQVMVAYLNRRHYRPHGRELRACHPRDLLDQVVALAHFRGHQPTITRDLLDRACSSYFLDEPIAPAVPPPTARRVKNRLDIH